MLRALSNLFTSDFSQAVAGFAGVTLLRALGGLVILKLMASHFEPEVFGRFGQLMAIVAIVSTFAGGGTTQALVQSLSSAANDEARSRHLSAAIKIFLGTGMIGSLLLIGGSPILAQIVLDRPDLAWVFWILAATQWLVGAGSILQVMFSAMRRTGTIVAIQAIGVALGLVLFVVLISQAAFVGAALGVVFFPAAIGLAAIAAAVTFPKNWRPRLVEYRPEEMRALLSFAVVVLVNISAVPLAQMAVRDHLGELLGWEHVGYWQCVLKISDLYMQFIGMLMTYYALPRFSTRHAADELAREITHIRKPLFSLMLLGFAAIYGLRHFIIVMIFSEAYVPAVNFVLPQLAGDSMRVLALLYVYAAMARGERLMPILFELLQGVSLFTLSHALVSVYHELAPAYGYMYGCALSLVILFGAHRFRMARYPSGTIAPTA